MPLKGFTEKSFKIAFYKAEYGKDLDKWISFLTNGPYSHVELIFDSISFSASARDNGVRYKDINYIPERWTIIELPDTKINIVWCDSQLGKKYDYIGALCSWPGIGFNYRDRWFCSEICATVLKKHKLYFGNTKISPNKLYSIIKEQKW